MDRRRTCRCSLFAAGVLSLSMGAFHFWLPSIFGWARAMAQAPSSLQWALMSLNFFWSLLALLTGALVLILAGRGDWSSPAGRCAVGTLAGYWAVHAAYLLLRPFPLPPHLGWLGVAFVGFAAVQAILHGVPALAGGRERTGPAQA